MPQGLPLPGTSPPHLNHLSYSFPVSIVGKHCYLPHNASEIAVHQALISDALLNDMCRLKTGPDLMLGQVFADDRWRVVRSSAPRRSWLVVLSRNGFPCGIEHETIRVDPVADLIGIGQFAGASREQLLKLTLWLAQTLPS